MEQPLDIQFRLGSIVVSPRKNHLVYSTFFYNIYGTNYPQFFIKIYKSEDEELNVSLADLFGKVSNTILHTNHLSFKLHSVLSVPPLRALLIDSYYNDFSELFQKKHFTTYYDVLKFLYQITHCVEELSSETLVGLFIAPHSVIVDHHMNFRLTNLDIDLHNPAVQALTTRQEFFVYQFAPEFHKNQKCGTESNIWDIGVILYAAICGIFPNVDYENESIFFNEQALQDNKKLANLLKAMLNFQPANRPSPFQILELVGELVANTIEPLCINTKLVNSLEYGRTFFDFANQMNHKYFENFVPETAGLKRFTGNFTEGVALILSNDMGLQDEVLQLLASESWSNPDKHIKFYLEIKEGLEKCLPNPLSVLKLFIALHMYLFKGSRHALIVFLKDGQTNALESILRLIHRYYLKMNETLILNYSIFLLKKFKFHFTHIKLIENNYSINRYWFFDIWPELLSGNFLADFLNHFAWTFSLFTCYKRYKLNYLTKNFILIISKELVNQFSVLANITSLVLYIHHHVKIAETEHAAIVALTDRIIQFLDNYLSLYNIAIEEMGRSGSNAISNFALRVNVIKKFELLRKRISEKSTDFSIIEFAKIALNFVVRLPESLEKVKKTHLGQKLEEKAYNLRLAREKLRELANHFDSDDYVTLFLFSMTASLRIVENAKLGTSEAIDEYTEEVSNTLDNIQSEYCESIRENQNTIQKPSIQLKDADIQTDPIIKKVKQGIERNSKQVNEAGIKKDEPLEGKSVIQLQFSALPVSQIEDNFDSTEGLEKFLMKAFARSVDEWIIEFHELRFDSLIASGSTCNVYRGSYKNLTVAIKKLVKPESDNKIKFLKEFKRELSILVSIPNHSSLLTLVGFCIKDHEVYLVSEFCEGGTLFDLLYKKSIAIKLN
jgi:serine/threonine protein kinase